MNDKIAELEKQIERMKNEIEALRKKGKQEADIGFEDDPIFLLSVEEYKKYKDKIPTISHDWWLRSPGLDSDYAATVNSDGSVYGCGLFVNDDLSAVRPAIRVSKIGPVPCRGRRFLAIGATWKIIDFANGIAIAEMPIMFSRFDEKSNDYEKSEVRKKLLDWYKERVEW